MRRLQRATRPGHAARLDRFEFARAVFVRDLTSESPKRRINRFRLPVCRMVVLAVRIRLPDFDQRVRYGFAVAVKDRADQFHALAFRVWSRDRPHGIRVVHRDGKIRADGAPRCRLEHAPGLTSCAQKECSPFRAPRCRTGIQATILARCGSTRIVKSPARAPSRPELN